MCTVSFVPLEDGFVIHSNRDEKVNRPTSYPKLYFENGIALIYPKDEKAGGTWVVAREDGACIILLNGAFSNHQKKDNYRKSRGQIVKEIIGQSAILNCFLDFDLTNIEPFTLIIFQDEKLIEVKWDGENKFCFPKSINQQYIWSSTTLYNTSQSKEREKWFEEFCHTNTPLTIERLFTFHNGFQSSNSEFGLVINREDNTKTVSITQLIIKNKKIEMHYIDKLNSDIKTKICF